MARKVAQATLITMARPAGIVVQGLVALMVSVVALRAHELHRPFVESIVNRSEMVGIASFCITAWLAVLMSQDGITESGKQALSISIILLNLVAVLYVLWLLLREAWIEASEQTGVVNKAITKANSALQVITSLHASATDEYTKKEEEGPKEVEVEMVSSNPLAAMSKDEDATSFQEYCEGGGPVVHI